jgi:hypothetical protein
MDFNMRRTARQRKEPKRGNRDRAGTVAIGPSRCSRAEQPELPGCLLQFRGLFRDEDLASCQHKFVALVFSQEVGGKPTGEIEGSFAPLSVERRIAQAVCSIMRHASDGFMLASVHRTGPSRHWRAARKKDR